MKEEKKKKKGFFKSISTAADKAGEAMEKAGNDVKDTAKKMQEVLEDSNENVKLIVKVAIGITLLAAGATLFNAALNIFGKKKLLPNTPPTIVIENLYLGGPLQ